MTCINGPTVSFSSWRKWSSRDRLSDDLDIDPSFGLLGLYLLGIAVTTDGNTTERHLDEGVLYIGMSSHVTRRLEKYHDAVARYKRDSGDISCRNLWYADWESPWSNWHVKGGEEPVGHAYVSLMERKLLFDYVTKFKKYPRLNRL